jgi:flagellum-specific peptidoglycan hydrolase FlgJ
LFYILQFKHFVLPLYQQENNLFANTAKRAKMTIEQVELDSPLPPNRNGEMPRMYPKPEYPLAIPNNIQAGKANFFKKISLAFQGLWHTFRPSQFRRHLTLANAKYLFRRYSFAFLATAGFLYWLQSTTPFARENAKAEIMTENIAENIRENNAVAGWLNLSAASTAAKTTAPIDEAAPTAEAEATQTDIVSPTPALAKIPNPTISNQQTKKSSALLSALAKIPVATQTAFLKRFVKVAQDEMQKFGVPASITLAFAIAYSEFGGNSLAQTHNNFFAVQCDENKITIGVSGKTTPEYNPNFCFMHFENAWSSFRTHSLILASEPYQELAKIANGDYKVWAIGLERLGYRQHDASFSAESLREIIEAFDLQRFDAIKINP